MLASQQRKYLPSLLGTPRYIYTALHGYTSMPKRKASHADSVAQDVAPRRSTRQRTSTQAARDSGSSTNPKPVTDGASKPVRSKPAPRSEKDTATREQDVSDDGKSTASTAQRDANILDSNETPSRAESQKAATTDASESTSGRQYWLLKAEPESRFENGVDVKFSIDDLAARTEPEPWDGELHPGPSLQGSSETVQRSWVIANAGIVTGIRNYVGMFYVWERWVLSRLLRSPLLICSARNNLRAMKQGDLAFFYHSNTKEPGIVGTMEIVQEHSPDRMPASSLLIPCTNRANTPQYSPTTPEHPITTRTRRPLTPNGLSFTSGSEASSPCQSG